MGGVGGPLLCIGDLLSDMGDMLVEEAMVSSSASPGLESAKPRLDLTQSFQENYNQLNEALSETGHSWTALTLKLCTALETADKLIQSANSDAKLLSEKVQVLHNIVRREDSAVATVKHISNV